MDFDDQLRRFFGTADLTLVTPEAFEGGAEQMRVALGLDRDPARRFALWSILYMLGAAPDLEATFKDAGQRDAARNFMDMIDRAAAPDD